MGFSERSSGTTVVADDAETKVTTLDTVEKTIDSVSEEKSLSGATVPENQYLEGWALAVVMTGFLLSLFLPALDQLILSKFLAFCKHLTSFNDFFLLSNRYSTYRQSVRRSIRRKDLHDYFIRDTNSIFYF